ncbi:MAG: hypothetical protein GVY19_04065 [Bacteroidetes bacterium]|nr:hypothetical protein [Bacteroidota bacterium]
MIFLIDIAFAVLSFLISNYILNEFYLSSATIRFIAENIPYIIFCRAIAFLIFETHASDIRYTSIRDLLGIFVATGFGSVLIFVANLIHIYSFNAILHLSVSLLATDLITVFFILTSYRLLIKSLYVLFLKKNVSIKNAVIFGIDEKGLLVKKYIDKHIHRLKIVAFLDENIKNRGKVIENTPIYIVDELELLINKYHVTHLLIPKTMVSQFNKIMNASNLIEIKLIEFPNISLQAINPDEGKTISSNPQKRNIELLRGYAKGSDSAGNNYYLN